MEQSPPPLKHTQAIIRSNSGLVQGLCGLQHSWLQMLRWCHSNLSFSISGLYFPLSWLHSFRYRQDPSLCTEKIFSNSSKLKFFQANYPKKRGTSFLILSSKAPGSSLSQLGSHIHSWTNCSDQGNVLLELVKSRPCAHPWGIAVMSDQLYYMNLRMALFHKGKSRDHFQNLGVRILSRW